MDLQEGLDTRDQDTHDAVGRLSTNHDGAQLPSVLPNNDKAQVHPLLHISSSKLKQVLPVDHCQYRQDGECVSER